MNFQLPPSRFKALTTELPRRIVRAARRLDVFKWLLSLPLMAASGVAGCSRASDAERAPTWISQGGEFGRNVRDGKVDGVAHHRLHSQALGQEVGVVVATPPGYASSPERRYPVVYAFPGLGGDEWSYLSETKLDGPAIKALFADPAQAPILVFGNPGNSGGHGAAERMLGEELVAFIDSAYRTRPEATGRSLEGFSLGGVTVLSLLSRHPGVFGRAVAGSSACYLISACGALRENLRTGAKAMAPDRVMLTVGAKENADNRSVNEELAPLLGVELLKVPNADHDWPLQLRTNLGTESLGQRVAKFHLAGFAAGERGP